MTTETSEYVTLAEAANESPGRPHVASVWRWCRRGVRARTGERIHLEHIRAGGKIFTTRKALGEFFRAVAEADAVHFTERGNRS